ncbi:MarR family transcriptional regulator [Candidatus Micrarchaeota archaeon]|nr:MarR family transcriptional regulator [Candidatus Micrarchaeota archaeon]
MLTFACKKIDLEDIVRCSFDLNKTEYKVMMYLLKHSRRKYRVTEVAKGISLTRTSVQKAIKRLVDRGLVIRFQKNLPGGGYTYVYQIEDKKRIMQRMKDIVTSWYHNVIKAIDTF